MWTPKPADEPRPRLKGKNREAVEEETKAGDHEAEPPPLEGHGRWGGLTFLTPLSVEKVTRWPRSSLSSPGRAGGKGGPAHGVQGSLLP